jgi:hypothetical protein
MTKRIKNILFFTVILISILSFSSCKKASNDKKSMFHPSKEKLILDKNVKLMEGMAACGINLHDTVNNIKGLIVFPRINQKQYSSINTKPISKLVETNIQSFVKQVKINNKTKGKNKDANIFNFQVKYCQNYKDIISCVFDKKIHYSQSLDTISSFQSVNYNKKTGKILSFYDVFKVNDNNIKAFQNVFGKQLEQYSKEEMKNIDFNIEEDTISLNIVSKNNNKQIRLRQPLSKVESFIGNGN